MRAFLSGSRATLRAGWMWSTVLFAGLLGGLALVGCAESESAPPVFSEADLLPADTFRNTLDEVLVATADRTLDTAPGRHAGWQIVHGLIPFGTDLWIMHRGNKMRALEVALSGEMPGWNMRVRSHGVESTVESGSSRGPGHPDQWLGYLAGCPLELNDTFYLDENKEKQYKIADLYNQALWSCNAEKEMSWTLMALAQWGGADPNNSEKKLQKLADLKWEGEDGSEWTVARVMEIEAKQNIASSACGGTHRLMGLTMALNRYLAEGGELVGPWKQAHEVIHDCLAKCQRFQQPDGALSVNFFTRAGKNTDISKIIYAHGHTLEWAIVAMNQKEFEQPWVRKAAEKLCECLEQTRNMDVECGALYHAAHALVLYRQRAFGMRSFDPNAIEAPASEKPAGEKTVPVTANRG